MFIGWEVFSLMKNKIIEQIEKRTKKGNIDNISRTESYAKFYERHKEIKWAFLASMVSRNAGWCMTDLAGPWYQKAISAEMRQWLFLTYEKANWLIFSDAYPQLLMYEYSKKYNQSFFPLLHYFNVSSFMIQEWERYLAEKNDDRLLCALIINEQHIIQKPVIEQKDFVKNVFHSFLYMFQDFFHFSTVIFPTLDGKLYGCSIYHFRNVTKRIHFGRCLAALLFHPLYYEKFRLFSTFVPHTGSRFDYEKFLHTCLERETPFLRSTYPIVTHDMDDPKVEWFHGQPLKKFFRSFQIPKKIEVTEWYLKKQKQLRLWCMLQEYLKQ
jgi:hypothetical protein